MLTVDLPPEPASATRARSLTREQLDERYSPETLETIALLVTELVTNAILHARTVLQLTVVAHPDRVRICVEDQSSDQPSLRDYDSDAVTGRGLALVDQLSTSWGVDSTPTGKVVWCDVPT